MFYVHTVQVKTYQGETSTGPSFAAAVTVPGFLDTTVTDVRTGTGDEATSARSMFYCDPTYGALFTVQSQVLSPDLGGDGMAVVTRLNVLTSGPLGLPDHVEVGLL